MMNSTLFKPSAIIFDFDDTLVNAKPVLNQAICATFAHFNVDNHILQQIDTNRSMRDYFREIFANNLLEARDVYYKYYHQFSHSLLPIEGAEEVLQFLKKQKIFTSIVSNKNGPTLRAEVKDKFKWAEYFIAIIGAGDAEKDKPSPLPAIMALQDLNLVDYKDVWLIGDSFVDIKTAENLNCKAILFGDLALNQDARIHKKVSNHVQLLKLLKEIYA